MRTRSPARRPPSRHAVARWLITPLALALAMPSCAGDSGESDAATEGATSEGTSTSAGSDGSTTSATATDATTNTTNTTNTTTTTTTTTNTTTTTTPGETDTTGTAGPDVEPAPTAPVAYTPTDEVFPNPERGIYRYVELTEGWDLQEFAADGTRLLFSYVRLDDYRTQAIAQPLLDDLEAGLDDARDAGLKVILRFAYNEGPYPDSEPDAPLQWVLAHIDQLAPLLAEHEDVIALVQAGFIGAWGEWHTSTNDLLPHKAEILSALLTAIPPSRTTQLRYPLYKDELYGAPLTEDEFLDGGDKARVGHHNDCFLASDTDEGTYPDDQIEPWKQYVEQDTAFVVMGGETCKDNPPRSECATALLELARFHYSFINQDWHPDVIASWQDGGCYETIDRLLGYRLQLTSAQLAPTARPGGWFPLVVELDNVGWAAPYNPRRARLVLSGPNGEHAVTLDDDLRTWRAGQTHLISGALRLPDDLTPGTYELALALPDESPTLAERPEYAIRLANEGVWSAGRNTLGVIEIDPDGPGGALEEQTFGFDPD
ncbi:MAG: DUF4832 domain-containing protein [Myxococcales bacterium]|nr:DUF4832 domain-containing protein [Myxococcales bacterium]